MNFVEVDYFKDDSMTETGKRFINVDRLMLVDVENSAIWFDSNGLLRLTKESLDAIIKKIEG